MLFHIDDLLITSKDKSTVDAMIEVMKSEFTAVTVICGMKHSYLAMNIVAQESVMLALGVAAAENHEIATVDVTGAFLECPLKDGDEN